MLTMIRPIGDWGSKSLYIGGRLPHMQLPEKKPMHSGARGGGILIA
jgi:hypothetical protein